MAQEFSRENSIGMLGLTAEQMTQLASDDALLAAGFKFRAVSDADRRPSRFTRIAAFVQRLVGAKR